MAPRHLAACQMSHSQKAVQSIRTRIATLWTSVSNKAIFLCLDTQLVRSGDVSLFSLKGQNVIILGFGSLKVSVTKTPLGHGTVKAASDSKSTNEPGWVLLKLYLQKQVAVWWITVFQPPGEIIEEKRPSLSLCLREIFHSPGSPYSSLVFIICF